MAHRFDNKLKAALSSSLRSSLYTRTNDIFIFENPAYDPDFVAPIAEAETVDSKSNMRLKDFLASVPSFAEFSEKQLLELESKAVIVRYRAGEVIFHQGDKGDAFYVIHEGSVDILVQENKSLVWKGDFGKCVNKLTEGCYFGERALMTAEPRAATIRACQDSVCLQFSRKVYEDIITGSNALIGKDVSDNVDWSKDHETRSLFRHIERILEIDSKTTSTRIRRVLYVLTTAFTPELSVDEVISRMVMTIKAALRGDRVGLFILSEDRRSMVLKVSERSKGVRLPVRGLAGAVIQSNAPLNIGDAYQDSRFDSTMDRRTGYRTRQVLGVPVRHPVTGETVGLLQVNNRADGSQEPFTAEHQSFLELTAEQLSELLHGRAEVFIQSGVSSSPKIGESMSSTGLVNSNEIESNYDVELCSLSLPKKMLEVIAKEGLNQLEIQVALFLAMSPLCEPRSSLTDLVLPNKKQFDASVDIGLDISLTFDILVRDLPRGTRILFRVGGRKKGKSTPTFPLGWAASTIYDFKGVLEREITLRFFSGDNVVPINTTLSNLHDPFASRITAKLYMEGEKAFWSGGGSTDHSAASGGDSFSAVRSRSGSAGGASLGVLTKIIHSMPQSSSESRQNTDPQPLTETQMEELDRIRDLSFNPLWTKILTDSDKAFIWEQRFNILPYSDLLPAFVMSVDWSNADRVQELYELLDLWAPPSPEQALQLMDRRFMDSKVRAYAAHCLEDFKDEELSLYMLQLCQQLKFENYIDSALSRFLLRRALKNQRLIGHIFFWLLQSEVYNEDVKRRFSILLQIYIRNCGTHRVELGHQMFVMKRLERVAEQVVQGTSKSERLQILRDQLRKTVLPTEFQLPLNPHIKVRGIDVDRCRVMESKKKPLWLTLINASEDPTQDKDVVLMLKVGDDLRQDALVMQLLRVMDNLWRQEGLDMHMQLYDCISTGDERGLLQVVLNATTLGHILMHATDNEASQTGGTSTSGSLTRKIRSAMKALSDFDVLKNWIWDQVCTELGPSASESRKRSEMERRTQNFMISTAAYCVASYVLGLGDRHNDNLMITKSAHFFHIDFGHILGNFKSKMGVKRERAPFVFTYAMKAVMRPDQYEAFVDLCCDIYNVLRENASLLVSLVSLAIPCNLPELQEEKDVMWMYEKLLVGATDEEAAEHFKRELEISLNTRTTRLNDAAHMIAHA